MSEQSKEGADPEEIVRSSITMKREDWDELDKALKEGIIPGDSRSGAIRNAVRLAIKFARLTDNQEKAILDFADLVKKDPKVIEELVLLRRMREGKELLQ